jgi:hypothetical protein
MAGDYDLIVFPGTSRSPQITSVNRLTNRYRAFSYDDATATLKFSGAVDQVGPAEVFRSESYRFVAPNVIDAQVVTGTAGSPAVFWYSPYTSFHVGWQPLWLGGSTSFYESPDGNLRWSGSPTADAHTGWRQLQRGTSPCLASAVHTC